MEIVVLYKKTHNAISNNAHEYYCVWYKPEVKSPYHRFARGFPKQSTEGQRSAQPQFIGRSYAESFCVLDCAVDIEATEVTFIIQPVTSAGVKIALDQCSSICISNK